jgi:hypothetical protein
MFHVQSVAVEKNLLQFHTRKGEEKERREYSQSDKENILTISLKAAAAGGGVLNCEHFLKDIEKLESDKCYIYRF